MSPPEMSVQRKALGVLDELELATRVFVLDGHRLFAESLVDSLDAQPGIVVAGYATTLARARARLAEAPVDILIVDPCTLDGVSWDDIAACAGAARIAVVSGGPPAEHGVASQGVRGWFDKNQVLSTLLDALPKMAAGWAYFPPRRLGFELNDLSERINDLESSIRLFSALTPRERDVLGCLLEGKDRAAIAAELYLSEGTVRAHIEHLKAKLGAPSTLAAVLLARRLGWSRLLKRTTAGPG